MSLLRKPFIVSILISLVLIVAGCGNESVFDSSRSSNDKQFIMNYSTLNDIKTHEMKLKEGTIVNVIIRNESGRIDILVANVEGQEIYRGDNASSGKFSLKIPKTGTYKFSVAGSKAKGGVSFKVAE